MNFDQMSKKDKCAVISCGGSLIVAVFTITDFMFPADNSTIGISALAALFAIAIAIVSTILGFIGLGSKEYRRAALVGLIPFAILLIVGAYNLIIFIIDSLAK